MRGFLKKVVAFVGLLLSLNAIAVPKTLVLATAPGATVMTLKVVQLLPTLVLAKKLSGDLASMVKGAGGFSFAQMVVSEFSKADRENMSVILESIETNEYWKDKNSEYSPVAHELGHLLLNSNHTEEANLMAGMPNLKNATLTPIQCESLIRSPLIRQ